jgi:cytoskeletal protein CcmA (bactofilin family)
MSTTFGQTVVVSGEIRTTEDVTIEGRVDGPIHAEHAVVVVSATGHVVGDIIADDITVFGRVTGQLIATDIVDVRAGADVRGHVVSKRFVLELEASFEGRIEPQHLQAALSVARFNQKRRDAS